MEPRAAIVTGGSSGIGLAIARALGEEGFGLTIAGRRREKLEPAVEELRQDGIEAYGTCGDLGEEGDVLALVASHRSRFGRLDVLANSAGAAVGGESLAELSTKRLDLALRVNLRAVLLLSRECIPMLREAGAEHGKALIVNVASIAAKIGLAGRAAYSAAKAGVVASSQALNAELAADGVQVTALCPGYVQTPMVDLLESPPEGQMIRPEDLAEAVRFLLRTSPACRIPELELGRTAGRV